MIRYAATLVFRNLEENSSVTMPFEDAAFECFQAEFRRLEFSAPFAESKSTVES